MPPSERELYTRRFFDAQSDASARSARQIVPIIMQLLAPKSLLDVGCGTGAWLNSFAAAGVADYLGIDGDYVDRAALSIPADRFQSRDLKTPFDLGRKFDLVISLEVAEHLPLDRAESFVATLTAHAPVVLFSAAIPFQGGTGHLNEQFQSYWIEQFSRANFQAIDCIRPRIWRDPNVAPWYAQNAFLMAHRDAIERFPALARELNQPVMPADIVHPVTLINSLANLDSTLRIELWQPTREQRALAANVSLLLDRRARDPNDARTLDALKQARGELALIFADAPAAQLPAMFGDPLAQTYRQLMQSDLRHQKCSDAERAFIQSRFPAELIDWTDPQSPGQFLSRSLYHFPHALPVQFDRALIPVWLADDVAKYLATAQS